jgi:exodeoxyribonuclease VIII
MSYSHLMVDLETLGNRPGCQLASIGAVWFDPMADAYGDELYIPVKMERVEKLHIDPDTVGWWMKQSDQARKVFQDSKAISHIEACLAFQEFVEKGAGKNTYFWSHGASFDYPILAAVFQALGFTMIPPYWQSRCTRTVFDAAGLDAKREMDNLRGRGTHHNALDDARVQAKLVTKAFQILYPKPVEQKEAVNA